MPSSRKRASAKPAGKRPLQLPRPSVPHQRGLLRGREISLYYGRQGPSRWAEHAYAQAKIAVLFEPAVGLFSWRAASGQHCEQRMTGRQIRGVPPGQRHAWQWEQTGEVLLIFLEPSFLQRVPQKNWRRTLTGASLPLVCFDPVFWQLASVLRALCQECDRPAGVVVEAAACALALRYFSLDEEPPAPSGGQRLSPERQQRVLDYIQQNLANPGLRVAHLAKLVALSPPHFTEVFRHTLGRPPMEQVRRCRLLQAHQLVQTRNHRMGEIADACGFCDASHLGREFRNFFGYPPRLLRGGTRPIFPPALPPDRPGLTITPVYFSEISESLTGRAPLPAYATHKIQHPQFT
jgi:AraC family transcriptional regulator